jgi:hypothetical protein
MRVCAHRNNYLFNKKNSREKLYKGYFYLTEFIQNMTFWFAFKFINWFMIYYCSSTY